MVYANKVVMEQTGVCAALLSGSNFDNSCNKYTADDTCLSDRPTQVYTSARRQPYAA